MQLTFCVCKVHMKAELYSFSVLYDAGHPDLEALCWRKSWMAVLES